MKKKIIRMTTVPISMDIILKGQLGFMNNYFEILGVSSYDEKHLKSVTEREGIRTIAIEMSRTIDIFNDILSLIKLILLFIKEKPFIVHTHTPKAGFLGMLAAYITRVPLRLHTVGGLPLTEVKGHKRCLLNIVEKISYYCAHRIYPNSFGLKKIILYNKFCSEEKLKVLGNGSSNGVNTDFFTPEYKSINSTYTNTIRKNLGIQTNEIVFCFIGRIAIEKGILELIEVFEKLQKKYPVKLLLIGVFEKNYGVLGDEVKQIIYANSSIICPGRFDDVRPYYALSDIYVFPSYREGFPNSVMEAGAMGLPCIVTNINGCNEIVQHMVNGLIVEPKDTVSLLNAMELLIKDSDLRKHLSRNARLYIESCFKNEVIWNELLKEYNSLINFLQDD